MKQYREIITPLHTRTSREYLPRMTEDKVRCMAVAKRYGQDYWDGDKCYGYGGYRYDGRWKSVAERLIETYGLKSDARILDVGCGKAYLLYELKKLLPDAQIRGFDPSLYALEDAFEEIREGLIVHRAENPYPWPDGHFDLVLSINSLHNLEVPELKNALAEIERTGREKFICVESYRNDQEQFNLQCWALTCEAFFSERAWKWLFKEFGYTGDYEFIYFE
ncbi:methyltransferase domain-containing protein [Pseudodesulfovibrio cashew]|uniref:Methyltransferase domain-containing protein n=1 Tax=Pseudodesulfovibrio cashew TaxID=2678688 RepID=A0A6I6J9P1_9BACT|nr:class I SAM-dependent methyltransferase [Pseudodesulfovibrio cashew]QGY39365.1 methyltransferase domain-containing protein [Pseudodesulfovibrio cashew]